MESISSPKQDRMISLIAWLIVMSLLFYLTVLTFEAFLRLTPEIQITQQVEPVNVETQNTDYNSQSTMVDPTDLSTDFVSNSDSEVVDPAEILVEPVTEVASIQDPAVEVSTPSVPIKSPEIEQVPVAQVQASRSVKTVDSIDENILMGSVNRELSELSPTLNQLRLGKSFLNRSEAFSYLKQIDYGELDISLELVQRANTVHVFVGNLMSKADVDRLQQYLSVRNNGLSMNILGSQEREDLMRTSNEGLSRPQVSNEQDFFSRANSAPQVAVLNSDFNFWDEAKLKPYTIQVGSFLKMGNARSLSDQLRSKSFSSDVETFFAGGVEQFRVLVGNFASRSEATKFATQLSEKEALPVYVRTASDR